jgi:HK97 family phage major capsid protein
MNLKDMYEKRAKLIADARAEFDKIKADTTEADAKEFEKRFDGFMGEADALSKKIDRQEKLERAEADIDEPIESRAGRGNDDDGEATGKKISADYERVFRSYCLGGLHALDRDQIKILRTGFVAPEKRAQSTSTTAGGYTIAESFMRELEKAMLAFGGMLEVSRILRTDTGAAMPWPTVDDTSNEGALVSENTDAGEQDVTFGTEQLDAYLYTTKYLKISNTLLQDSAFDLGVELPNMLAERFARILNRHTTVGTGSSQPQGVVGASTAGVTLTSSTDITFDELIDLEHSLEISYRRGARWMFHDNTLKVLRKKKDSDNNYIWSPGTRDGIPPKIWNYDYTINQHMPVLGSGNKAILFGDFKKYIIRMVRDVNVRRLDELFAIADQAAFVGFGRFDGELIDAGTHPIRHAVCPSP